MKTIKFKEDFDFQKRKKEFEKINSKYPDRIPIIVHKSHEADSKVPDLDKFKFLLYSDMTVGNLVSIIRKRISLEPSHAIFIYVHDTNFVPPTASPINTIYDEFKEDDGFLYINYTGENAFGGNIIHKETNPIDTYLIKRLKCKEYNCKKIISHVDKHYCHIHNKFNRNENEILLKTVYNLINRIEKLEKQLKSKDPDFSLSLQKELNNRINNSHLIIPTNYSNVPINSITISNNSTKSKSESESENKIFEENKEINEDISIPINENDLETCSTTTNNNFDSIENSDLKPLFSDEKFFYKSEEEDLDWDSISSEEEYENRRSTSNKGK